MIYKFLSYLNHIKKNLLIYCSMGFNWFWIEYLSQLGLMLL